MCIPLSARSIQRRNVFKIIWLYLFFRQSWFMWYLFVIKKGLLALEILLIIYTIAYLVIIGKELYISRFALYMKSLALNPSKVLLILSFFMTLLRIPLRVACESIGEDYLIILSIICKCSYVLYLGRYDAKSIIGIKFFC